MNPFETYESEVRSYSRAFPVLFKSAKGARIIAEDGREYIDFLSAAGSVNYGHNNDFIKARILDYIRKDGLIQGLDFYTDAKSNFIQRFQREILSPRRLDYKIQFCGPTGTNAVEAALKLARKVKGRSGIFTFMGGYHGMTQGSLSITSNLRYKEVESGSGAGVSFLPYPSNGMEHIDTLEYLDKLLGDDHSGMCKPAAVIFETIQGEGGINVAPDDWIKGLFRICRKHDILVICDEIQMGCYRTGKFFSFERADVHPDIVLLSKSISGMGFPMSILLMRPELDIWQPGEHSGTFRGFQLGFVGAVAALDFISESALENSAMQKAHFFSQFLSREVDSLDDRIVSRGMGMVWGIDLGGFENEPGLAKRVAKECFRDGLIIETVGRKGAVLKILPPLTIGMDLLKAGCEILRKNLEACISQSLRVRSNQKEIA